MDLSAKKVVVVGGGISGLVTARLIKSSRDGRDLEVTIVNPVSYLEWAVAGSYSLTHPDEFPKAVSGAGRHVPTGCKLVVGKAVSITDNEVVLDSNETLPYDAVVIATGFNCPFIKSEGTPYEQRKQQVDEIGAALRTANSVLVGGGGNMAVEFACDVREVNPNAKVTIVARGNRVLGFLSDKYQGKVDRRLAAFNIDVITNETVQEPAMSLESKPYQLKSGATVDADVYMPAYTQGLNGGFSGAANDKGAVLVNDFLQSTQNEAMFAVGCSDREYSSIMKVEGQAHSVAVNVINFLSGQPLVQHAEKFPMATHAPMQKMGHNSYAFVEYELMDIGPCLKTCGFPFCCPFCCWPLALCGAPCHPMSLGCCCGDVEGAGTMSVLRMFTHGTGSTGIEGLGDAYQYGGGPAAEEMVR